MIVVKRTCLRLRIGQKQQKPLLTLTAALLWFDITPVIHSNIWWIDFLFNNNINGNSSILMSLLVHRHHWLVIVHDYTHNSLNCFMWMPWGYRRYKLTSVFGILLYGTLMEILGYIIGLLDLRKVLYGTHPGILSIPEMPLHGTLWNIPGCLVFWDSRWCHCVTVEHPGIISILELWNVPGYLVFQNSR